MRAPLMEDVDMVEKLRKRCGPPLIVPCPVVTSSRRWQRLGYARATLLNWCTLGLYKLGVSPARLAVWYYSIRE